MKLEAELERLSRGWRGPAVAAFVAFLAGLPGMLAVPPLDRDGARFAQATAQMLESRDFVVIRYQDEPRFKKPVGIHWLQAASVTLLSSPEARQIWAYRIPSLLGAMLAAAACA
jgi:4-amino-4-deoxy-L-arabinose transferase-like glycosyltransferase